MSLALYAIRIVLSLLNKILFSYIKASDSLCKEPYHRANGFPFIETTLRGIVILAREPQSEKAQSPILVTLLGMVILLRALHR